MNNYDHTEIEQLRDRISDIDPDLIGPVLLKRGQDLRKIAEEQVGSLHRTELSLALQGLVERAGIEIERLASTPHDVENSARAVRNCMESNLITRYILDSRENLKNWLMLRAQEEIDILSSALKVITGDVYRKPLERRINELKGIAEKYSMTAPSRIPRWNVLADKYKLKEDYDGLYGVFSKYVHPSAWLIVKPDVGYTETFTHTFVVYAQVYAADLTERALVALGVKGFQLSETSWGQHGISRIKH